MKGTNVLERIHALFAMLLVASLIATPSMTLASDANVATPASTEAAEPTQEAEEPSAGDEQEVEPGDEGGEVPSEEAGETEVLVEAVEDDESSVEETVVDESSDEADAPMQQSRDQPMQLQQAGNLTLHITSSDPDIADTLGQTSIWSVSTRSNGRVLQINTSGRDLSLPMELTSTWLNNVPTGEAIITVDGGPQFAVWSQPVDVIGGAQIVNVELQVLQSDEVSSGVFNFTIQSSRPDVLNQLPVSTSFQVFNVETNERVFSRAGLANPAGLPITVLAPASTSDPLPFGEYRVEVRPPSGFQSETLFFTLSSPNQAETITLRPLDAPVETFTGTVQVVEADGTTPVANAAVTLGDDGLTDSADEAGTVDFAGLEDGRYNVTVVAADGRTAEGVLEIAGANAPVSVTLPELVTSLALSLVCPEITGAPGIGDVINITFEVTNDGNVPITHLRGSIWQSGTNTRIDSDPPIPDTLAPGESAQAVVAYPLVFADTNRGQIYGRAQVAGQRPNGSNIVVREQTTACTFAQHEDFTVSANAPVVPEDTTVGDEITIPVVVTNTGSTNLQRPTILNDRDDAVERTLAIGPNSERTYNYTTTVTQEDMVAGNIEVEFTVVSGQPQGNSPTRTAVANVILPAIFTEMVVDLTCPDLTGVRAGDEVILEFTITNTGNVNMENSRATVYQTATRTLFYPAEPIPTTMAPGQEVSVTVVYVVDESETNAGNLRGSAQVAGVRPNGTNFNYNAGLSPCVFEPFEDFSIAVGCPEIPSDVVVGDEVTFDVVLTNEGDTVVLWPQVTTNRAEAAPRVLNISHGGTRTFAYTTAITQEDVDAGSLNVNFSITPETPKSDPPVVRTAEVNCLVTQEPEMAAVTVNVVSADPEIANALPNDATWTVSYEGQEIASDTFAAEHLELPAAIVVNNAIPFGDYEISIDTGPTLEPIVGLILTVNQQTQAFTVELQPVGPVEETHTGVVRVVEADETTPVVGATVSIFNDEDAAAVQLTVFGLQSDGGGTEWGPPLNTGVTDETGAVIFTDLPDGVYGVAVVAEDGRTATGTLSINGADSTTLIVMQAIPDPVDPVDPTDPADPPAEDKKPDPVTKLPETGSGSGTSSMMMLMATAAAALMGTGGMILRKNRI